MRTGSGEAMTPPDVIGCPNCHRSVRLRPQWCPGCGYAIRAYRFPIGAGGDARFVERIIAIRPEDLHKYRLLRGDLEEIPAGSTPDDPPERVR